MSLTRILAIALALQAVLVAVSWWPREPAGGRSTPVFDMPRDDVDTIEISSRPAAGAEETPLVLARSGDGWVIRSRADFPAQEEKVDAVLDAALGLRIGAPVATHAESHEALSVADDDYGRRLSLGTAEGESSAWLVGAATSRSVYLRRVGEDEVYRAAGASEWTFRDQASSYWDDRYVAADASAFDAVAVVNEHGSLRFERADGLWTLADLAEGETADEDAIDRFVSAVANLRMREPVGKQIEPGYGLDAGARVDWTLTSENQSLAGGYVVGADVDSDAYVKAVDHPFVVRVAQSAVKRLRDATRSQFLE